MLILYITYIDFGEAASGSGVRPQKMYRAFLDEGHTVKLLSGEQGTFRSEARARRSRAVAEVSSWLDSHRPDLCYIESPVYPILWGFDRQLIRKIHRMGIPMGYFYRDFYWKFPELYPKRKDLVGGAKELFLDLMQRCTDAVLENADIVYFPCAAAGELFSFRDKRPLPPAGEDRLSEDWGEQDTCIYVGGFSGDYGGKELLRAFQLLNKDRNCCKLLLVCRAKEWAAVPPELKTGPWLEVHHTSGAGLVPLYRRASLAVIPVQRNPYTDVSVNVKIFEYMSYGLPVASTDVTAIAELVEKNDIGRVSGADPASLADNIRAMLDDPEGMARWRANSRRTLLDHDLWIHRVRQVVRDLTEKNG